eukprot:c26097_g1_i1 orf=143-577(-)
MFSIFSQRGVKCIHPWILFLQEYTAQWKRSRQSTTRPEGPFLPMLLQRKLEPEPFSPSLSSSSPWEWWLPPLLQASTASAAASPPTASATSHKSLLRSLPILLFLICASLHPSYHSHSLFSSLLHNGILCSVSRPQRAAKSPHR